MRPHAAINSPTGLTPTGAALALAAALTTVAVVTGLVPLPDPTGALEDASRTLGAWAYPAVGGLAFLETGAFVGLAIPGETAVVVGGVVASTGRVELIPLIGLVWIAATAGDLVSFLLGRRYGRALVERHGKRVRLDECRVHRVERFYDRHGGSAVLLGRFVGVVRAVSPFIAGSSGFALRRFLPWSVAGALAWATAFTLVGYAFSESFASSGDMAARVALGVVLLAAYVAGAALEVIKLFIERARPEEVLGAQIQLSHDRSWAPLASFPSGHLIVTSAMAAAAASAVPALRRPLLAYAAMVALTRVTFGAHFPLDVMVGAVVGYELGVFAARLMASGRMLPAPRTVTARRRVGVLAHPS